MDDWGPRIAEVADGPGLAAAVDRLVAAQLASWPLLARGVDGVARARDRALAVDGRRVVVRHIPHRIQSVTARVDPRSIASRPCFLCPGSLPAEERGVAYGEEWVLLCNPFPILERHLSIVHRRHTPQRLGGRAATLLDLALRLPGAFVLYNGPECGASAPDHLHFQACSRSLLPLEDDVRGMEGPIAPDGGRRLVVLRGSDGVRLAAALEGFLAWLSTFTDRTPEPMVNVTAYREGGAWTVCVFPRGKHRPAAFHTGELTVSPGAVDLCGVLVTPVEADFHRVTADAVRAVFDEVCLPRDAFERLAASGSWRP